MIEANDGQALIAHASKTSNGGVRFVVPEVPGKALRGGVVVLTLADGELSCAPVTISLQGLENAEGAFDEFAWFHSFQSRELT